MQLSPWYLSPPTPPPLRRSAAAPTLLIEHTILSYTTSWQRVIQSVGFEPEKKNTLHRVTYKSMVGFYFMYNSCLTHGIKQFILCSSDWATWANITCRIQMVTPGGNSYVEIIRETPLPQMMQVDLCHIKLWLGSLQFHDANVVVNVWKHHICVKT